MRPAAIIGRIIRAIKWVGRRLAHSTLDWHVPEVTAFNGATKTYTCKICKLEILQDAKGNWFVKGE